MKREYTYFPTTLLLCAILSACGGSSDNENTSEKEVSASYPIVDTGQVLCYGANITANETGEIECPNPGEELYGQDAQFSNNPISLNDYGDGTVIDNVTGLVWQQSPSDEYFTFTEAEAYADESTLAGYDDWRVPTLKELYSISNFGSGWPYIDTDYFHLADTTTVDKSEQYWGQVYVGHTEEGGYDAALGVNHVTGHIKAYPSGDGESTMVEGEMPEGMPEGGEVVGLEGIGGDDALPAGGPPSIGKRLRLVRGGIEDYGTNSFVDNENDTITDEATSLMWQKYDNDGQTMNWTDALAFAEAAETGGHSDWRLPSVKELQSIVDYTKSPTAEDADKVGPAIDTNFFVLTPVAQDLTTTYELYGNSDYGYYWTSTSAYFGAQDPEHYFAWYVAFGSAVDGGGNDYHGAGAVRFDTKKTYDGDNITAGDPERVTNYVLLVRDI